MASPSQMLFDFMNDRLALKKSSPREVDTSAIPAEVIEAVSAPVVQEVPQRTVDDQRLTDDHFVQSLEYRVRVSPRARQVLLRVQPGQGLIVTIPKRFAKRDIPLVLKEQRDWIERNIVAMDERVPDEYKTWPPSVLKLESCDCQVTIEFKEPEANAPRARWCGDTHLELTVDSNDRQLVGRLITGALKTRARKLLSTRITELAQLHGFYFKKLAVRAQRSVWGSYSSSGTLSLNYKLIFLRPELVDYVLLHELAHTRYLDHSPAFWRLVESLHPQALQLDKELNSACRYVPPWLENLA